jgi:hypothetical protein
MRDPRINPRPGDRLAKVLTNRAGVSGVFSRRVLALEKRFPHGTTVVWTRSARTNPVVARWPNGGNGRRTPACRQITRVENEARTRSHAGSRGKNRRAAGHPLNMNLDLLKQLLAMPTCSI